MLSKKPLDSAKIDRNQGAYFNIRLFLQDELPHFSSFEPDSLQIKEGIHPLIPNPSVIRNLLRTSDKKHTSAGQALIKLTEGLSLRLFREIDQNISAHDHLAIRGITILQEIMLLKLYAIFDLIGNLIGGSNLCKILSLKVLRHTVNISPPLPLPKSVYPDPLHRQISEKEAHNGIAPSPENTVRPP